MSWLNRCGSVGSSRCKEEKTSACTSIQVQSCEEVKLFWKITLTFLRNDIFDSQEEELIQEEVCEDVTEEKCVNFEVIIYKLVKEDRFFLNFSFVASVFLKLFSCLLLLLLLLFLLTSNMIKTTITDCARCKYAVHKKIKIQISFHPFDRAVSYLDIFQ